MSEEITLYGTPACPDTNRTQRYLDELGVDYRYVNVDEDGDASDRVEAVNGGKRMTPTLVLGGTLEQGDGEILAVPGNTDLTAALERHGSLPHSDRGDGSPGVQ
jgi:thioredoxin reductase (NADPH)